MNLLIVDDEIVTTQVLEEQLDRELLSIDQIYVAYNTSMARDILQKNKVQLINVNRKWKKIFLKKG